MFDKSETFERVAFLVVVIAAFAALIFDLFIWRP